MLLVVFGRVRLCRTSGARRLFQAHGRETVEHEGIGIAAAVLVQRALAAVEQGEDAVEALLVLQRDLQTGPPQGMARQPEGKGQLLLVARDGPRGRGVPAAQLTAGSILPLSACRRRQARMTSASFSSRWAGHQASR